MTANIRIAPTACIRCERCVRVCPAQLFARSAGDGAVGVHDPERCIICGHCVAACPTGAVLHDSFPPERVHAFDRNDLPTPEQVMLLCRARRSNRAFTRKPVPREMLERIVEAAHRAPTASNKQEVAFTLVTSPETLERISRFTVDTFASVVRKLENPVLRPLLRMALPQMYAYLPGLKHLRDEYARGNDLILRGATALLLIHTPGDNRFGMQDANLAYQNGSLMAESLGVSQFYTGFVCTALQQDRRHAFTRSLGIEGTIHAGMALGMPQFLFTRYIDKQPLRGGEI